MKGRTISMTTFIAAAAFAAMLAVTAAAAEPVNKTAPKGDPSFANEVQQAINRGLQFLLASQNTGGWWSTPDHPAVAALALSALMGDPSGRYRTNQPPGVVNGYAYLLASVKPDGSIYRTDLINYNTSLSMLALVAARNPAYDEMLRRGRGYIVRSQVDLNEPGKVDSPYDGGVGYNNKLPHSDMNNTLTALEALYYTRDLVTDKSGTRVREIDMKAAVQFLQSCQNLPGYNTQDWVATDATNKGGFVYLPGESKAGEVTNTASGRVALRSYGSISYAGLLSYIYADLKQDDPRVVAVRNWLRANYTLEENPGMGPQGFYYYLQLMAKALNLCGIDTLELKDGTKIDWRRDVATRMISLQKQDGSWSNANARWWESDPNLVTAYAVMSLEIIYPKGK